jgi:hypothetical protein
MELLTQRTLRLIVDVKHYLTQITSGSNQNPATTTSLPETGTNAPWSPSCMLASGSQWEDIDTMYEELRSCASIELAAPEPPNGT